MQDRFRQQYSKFGSTRKQYFHAWRSFHFDKATNTVDWYIHKVKQLAALLDYGEPQILELFKNTLPSKLYCMLYHIDDLKVAVKMVKRLLIKEQMDRKAGHSITSPFMQFSQNKDKMEKKVSFSSVEAMERTTDSIERLASLMDRIDTKLDRREDQYRPIVYQGRNQGQGYRRNNYNSRNRLYSRDRYQINYRGRRNYGNRGDSRNHRLNYRDSSISRDRHSYKNDNRYDHRLKYRGNKSSQRYSNRNQDHGRSRDRDRRNRSSSSENSHPGMTPKTDMKIEDKVGITTEIETGLSLDPGHLLE